MTPPTETKTTPTETKTTPTEKEGHLRFGRRISPEGMSHEEINSPKGEVSDEDSKPCLPTGTREDSLTSSGDTESASSFEKEVVPTGDGVSQDSRVSRSQVTESAVTSSPTRNQQRARSLSPKSPHRLLPMGVARVRDLEPGAAGLTRTTSSESTSSEGGTPSLNKKPLKSSLRQKRGGSNSRNSSSSSLEGVISPSGPRPTKVTISPRSSQVSHLSSSVISPWNLWYFVCRWCMILTRQDSTPLPLTTPTSHPSSCPLGDPQSAPPPLQAWTAPPRPSPSPPPAVTMPSTHAHRGEGMWPDMPLCAPH